MKAAIFMGDPHNVAGLPYNVGTCRAGGVSFTADLNGSHSQLTTLDRLVCRSPQRLPVQPGKPLDHPVVLRLDRPLLLQRQRRQLAPAVRQQVRTAGSGFHQGAPGCCVSANLAGYLIIGCSLYIVHTRILYKETTKMSRTPTCLCVHHRLSIANFLTNLIYARVIIAWSKESRTRGSQTPCGLKSLLNLV